jgi:hypothetical protein
VWDISYARPSHRIQTRIGRADVEISVSVDISVDIGLGRPSDSQYRVTFTFLIGPAEINANSFVIGTVIGTAVINTHRLALL